MKDKRDLEGLNQAIVQDLLQVRPFLPIYMGNFSINALKWQSKNKVDHPYAGATFVAFDPNECRRKDHCVQHYWVETIGKSKYA